MAYHNKRQILLNTLKSLEYYGENYPMEVIVVDDASNEDNKINDINDLFSNINIKLIVIKRPNPKWRGPSVAYNTGFKFVHGDVILINSMDCLHLGNIIGYVFNNFKSKTYLTFAAYKGSELPDDIFNELNWSDETSMNNVLGLIDFKDKNKWHFHSICSPSMSKYSYIPYSTAISRDDIETLSGYDERFIAGIGYEDSDLLVRTQNLGLEIIMVDNPFCVHQKHPPTIYYEHTNANFFWDLEDKFPDRIKVTTNTVYVR